MTRALISNKLSENIRSCSYGTVVLVVGVTIFLFKKMILLFHNCRFLEQRLHAFMEHIIMRMGRRDITLRCHIFLPSSTIITA